MAEAAAQPWSWPSLDEAPAAGACAHPQSEDREEAERVLARARDDAERIRHEVRGDAWAEARAEAEARLEAALRESVAEQTAAFDQARAAIIARIEGAASERLEELEQELAALIASMTEKVIRRKVATEDGVVLDVVRATIAQAAGANRLTVRVPADDEPLVCEATAELLALTNGAGELEIVADPGVGPGGCIVETERGRFDARIQTQVELLGEEIERVLGGGGGG